MTDGSEVTIAGKRYASAAAHIQSVLGTLRSLATQRSNPVEVTVEPDGELDPDEVQALA